MCIPKIFLLICYMIIACYRSMSSVTIVTECNGVHVYVHRPVEFVGLKVNDKNLFLPHLHGAVGALQPPSVHNKLLSSVHGNGMPTDKTNREIGRGSLLPQDWAGKR